MRIAVVSLGGTIAMTEAGTGGVVPTLSGKDLLRKFGIADPKLELSTISFRQLASAQLTPADLVAVAALTRDLAARFDGIVVTQGTDTIEETAFALDLLGPRTLPVVVTGAMRHPDAPGSDGAANFRDAAMVAGCKATAPLGPIVVMDGEVHAARFVYKSETATVRAFRSAPVGRLGWVKEGAVDLLVGELKPELPYIVLPSQGLIPRIAVLKSWLGDDGRLAESLIDLGYAGVVVEGMGGGHVHPAMAERLYSVRSKMPIIMSTRVVGSHVLQNTYGYAGSEIDLIRRGVMLGGWLSTGKLHLLLTYLLANGANDAAIGSALRSFGGLAA